MLLLSLLLLLFIGIPVLLLLLLFLRSFVKKWLQTDRQSTNRTQSKNDPDKKQNVVKEEKNRAEDLVKQLEKEYDDDRINELILELVYYLQRIQTEDDLKQSLSPDNMKAELTLVKSIIDAVNKKNKKYS